MSEWSIRRLSRVRDLVNAKRYLEIGVFAGETFNNFDCAHRDAVDPRFLFDPAPLTTPQTRFFQQTSDAFFTDPARDGEAPYDLVFIDGLHTYEQTLRDFLNVLTHTHDRSVILIDDTVPSDVYSAETRFKRVEIHRKRAGNKSGAWHGDVFKLVYFIRDFMPTLSFATILRSGNPQTIVWRQRRTGYEPMFDSTEAISRLTYFDMFERRGKMNNMEEDEAMQSIAAAFGARSETAL